MSDAALTADPVPARPSRRRVRSPFYAGLAVLMVTESAGTFVMLSTVVTTALVVAGTGASTLWFLRVLRRLGLASDIAPMVAMLASPTTGWITGQVLSVSGGYSMV